MRITRREFIGTFLYAFVGSQAVSCSAGFFSPPVEPGRRVLGRTGAVVSVVGMGAMQCADPSVIQYAVSKGINYIDTADCYMGGRNEKIVGKALKGMRDKVFLATKVHNGPEKNMVASIERSLRSLGTDYVDLMQLHGVSSRGQVFDERALSVLSKMKKDGKIRFAGVTTHSNQIGVIKAAVESKFYDTVLVAYNFRSPGVIAEEIKKAAADGVGIIGMKTQAGGYGAGAGGYLTPHQAALKFVIDTEGVCTTIPGMYSRQIVDENVKVMEMAEKSKSALLTPLIYGEIRDGGVCTFCSCCLEQCRLGAGGVDVGRVSMYLRGYGCEELAFEEAKKTLPELARCASCPSCTVDCRGGQDLKREAGTLLDLFYLGNV